MKNQNGAAHVLLLLAAIGVIAFLLISSSGKFKDPLFARLFPKPPSYAASSTQLGALNLTINGNSINVKLPIAGDDNNNATATLEYKKTTDTPWSTGPTLSRSAVQGVHLDIGSVKAATTDQAVPDAILVKFKKEIPEEDRQALRSRFNLTFDSSIQSQDTEVVTEDVPETANIFTRTFRSVFPNRVAKPKLDIIRFKVAPANRDRILSQLKTNPDVEYAELDARGQSLFTPNDPYYTSDPTNPDRQWDLPQINAPAAWDITRGNPSLIVAEIDTGVDTTITDLQGKLVGGYDFINNNTTISDCYGHGIAVGGRIAASTNNGAVVASLGANVKLMPLRDADCNGIFQVSNLVRAIRFAADNGAKVINISQGIGGNPNDLLSLRDAINYAVVDKKVVVVAAGGNFLPDKSIFCLNYNTGIVYPAAYPNAIAVGATILSGGIWSSSCPGADLDVVAPGAGVYSTGRGNTLSRATGTSFAAPQVAALAALILSVNPSLTPPQVASIITSSATDLGAAGRDDIFGYGRINALKALQQAGGVVPSTPAPTPTATPAPTIIPTATPLVTPIPTPTPTSSLVPIPVSTATPAPVVFNNLLSATIPNLEANTSYDIRITVTDPDGLVGSGVVGGNVVTGVALGPTPTPLSTPASTLSVGGYPTACNSYAAIGTVAWDNPANAKNSDDIGTGARLDSSGTLTSYALVCSGYGFNVPTGATIKGIAVGVERRRSNSSSASAYAQDAAVVLLKNGSATVNKPTTTAYTGNDITEDHGGSGDLWGTTWTSADINSPNFGIAFASKGNVSAIIDSIKITVHYTP